LFGIVKKLLLNLAQEDEISFTLEEIEYRNLLAKKIIHTCSKDMYTNVTNFEWYLQVLIDISKFPRLDVGSLVKDQLIDICVRVKQVREFAIELLFPLLGDRNYITASSEDVLYAAAWICGEYSTANYEILLEKLISKEIASAKSEIQAIYLTAFLKVFSRFVATSSPSNQQDYQSCLALFVDSPYLEVQERVNKV
jgi:AP-3 complex subunit delta-1